jgi:hypothetical protein
MAESKVADMHIQDLKDDCERLRVHNDALVSNIDRNTIDFETLAS